MAQVGIEAVHQSLTLQHTLDYRTPGCDAIVDVREDVDRRALDRDPVNVLDSEPRGGEKYGRHVRVHGPLAPASAYETRCLPIICSTSV